MFAGFTNTLREGKTIRIFNYGNCKRDFTYIDDIIEGVVRVMQHAPEKMTGEDGLRAFAQWYAAYYGTCD